MSDLISRSEVLELLYKIFDKYRMSTDKNTSIGKSFGTDVFEEIRNIPIAYSVDKVVMELEKLADESYKAYCIAFNSDDRAEYDAYTDAIEIVKNGDVSDDVCEWKQTSTSRYKTSCGYRLEEYFDTNACYCKQCGKKIKVVE